MVFLSVFSSTIAPGRETDTHMVVCGIKFLFLHSRYISSRYFCFLLLSSLSPPSSSVMDSSGMSNAIDSVVGGGVVVIAAMVTTVVVALSLLSLKCCKK